MDLKINILTWYIDISVVAATPIKMLVNLYLIDISISVFCLTSKCFTIISADMSTHAVCCGSVAVRSTRLLQPPTTMGLDVLLRKF